MRKIGILETLVAVSVVTVANSYPVYATNPLLVLGDAINVARSLERGKSIKLPYQFKSGEEELEFSTDFVRDVVDKMSYSGRVVISGNFLRFIAERNILEAQEEKDSEEYRRRNEKLQRDIFEYFKKEVGNKAKDVAEERGEKDVLRVIDNLEEYTPENYTKAKRLALSFLEWSER